MDLEDISTLLGIILLAGATVGVYLELRYRVKAIEKHSDGQDKIHDLCADLQARRYADLTDAIGELDKKLAVVEERLGALSEDGKLGKKITALEGQLDAFMSRLKEGVKDGNHGTAQP